MSPTTEANTMAKITESPWGQPDSTITIAPGIVIVCTPSHGGVFLSPERNALVPADIRAGTHRALGERGWYEEDVDFAIPRLLFRAEFDAYDLTYRLNNSVERVAKIIDYFRPGMSARLEDARLHITINASKGEAA